MDCSDNTLTFVVLVCWCVGVCKSRLVGMEGSTPCLVRQVLFAPPAPTTELGDLVERAVLYHNSGQHARAVEAYLSARSGWLSLLEAGDELPLVDVYFMCALGSVYESEGQDKIALVAYQEAAQVAAELPPGHPVHALTGGFVASVYAHLGQYALAESTFRKARRVRAASLAKDQLHVDVASLDNNIGVCLHMQGKVAAAKKLYAQAHAVLLALLGPDHPRTYSVGRNVAKASAAPLPDLHPDVPEIVQGSVYDPIAAGKKRKKKKKKN